MYRINVPSVIALVGCLFVCAGARPGATGTRSEAEEAALADFDRRVQSYAALHRVVEGPVLTGAVSQDPAAAREATDALAAKIMRARLSAHPGEIFAPRASAVIRDIIRESFAGSRRELQAIFREEQKTGTPAVPRVHSRWPEGVTPATVPSSVLVELPRLPRVLQYRFLGRHLVLWDAQADLTVDVLPNAISSLARP